MRCSRFGFSYRSYNNNWKLVSSRNSTRLRWLDVLVSRHILRYRSGMCGYLFKSRKETNTVPTSVEMWLCCVICQTTMQLSSDHRTDPPTYAVRKYRSRKPKRGLIWCSASKSQNERSSDRKVRVFNTGYVNFEHKNAVLRCHVVSFVPALPSRRNWDSSLKGYYILFPSRRCYVQEKRCFDGPVTEPQLNFVLKSFGAGLKLW